MIDYSKYAVHTDPWGEWRVMCDNTEGRTYPYRGTAECAMSEPFGYGTPLSEVLTWISAHQAAQHGPKVEELGIRVTANHATDKAIIQLASPDGGLTFELSRAEADRLKQCLDWFLHWTWGPEPSPTEGHRK